MRHFLSGKVQIEINIFWRKIFYVKAMEEKYCQRKIQQQFGIEFCNEENTFVIFEAQLINSSSVVRFQKYSSLSYFQIM